jgi:hypothetical protein
MFFHQSAFMDYKLYYGGNPGQIHQDWTIECWEEDQVKKLYLGGKLSIWELSAGGADGVPGWDGAGSVVRCLCRSSGGAPAPLRLLSACGFFRVPYWERRHLFVWLWQSIAWWLSITIFTYLSPRNSTPHFVSSQTLAGGCWYSIGFLHLRRANTLA